MNLEIGPNLLQVLTLALTVLNSLVLAWLHVRNGSAHGRIERHLRGTPSTDHEAR